jgi:hypothetical protein
MCDDMVVLRFPFSRVGFLFIYFTVGLFGCVLHFLNTNLIISRRNVNWLKTWGKLDILEIFSYFKERL